MIPVPAAAVRNISIAAEKINKNGRAASTDNHAAARLLLFTCHCLERYFCTECAKISPVLQLPNVRSEKGR